MSLAGKKPASLSPTNLSFIIFEGKPSRISRKRTEKAVRTQAAKASAAARKATIARKEAARSGALDGSTASDKEVEHVTKHSEPVRGHRAKWNERVQKTQEWKAQEHALRVQQHSQGHSPTMPWDCPDLATSDISSSGSLGSARDYPEWASGGHLLAARTTVDGHINGQLTPSSALWCDGAIERAINTAAASLSPDEGAHWPLDMNLATPADCALQYCDSGLQQTDRTALEHLVLEPQAIDESPNEGLDLRSWTATSHLECAGRDWRQVDEQRHSDLDSICSLKDVPILSAHLLETQCLLMPSLFSIVLHTAAYDNTTPEAAWHLHHLLAEVNACKPTEDELCRQSLDSAEVQNFVWFGLCFYAGCLLELSLHNTLDSPHNGTKPAGHEIIALPPVSLVGTKYDALLLWSLVSRCMCCQILDNGSYRIVQTLLRNLRICSFEELKGLMLDYAYHPTLFDEWLRMLWDLVAINLFDSLGVVAAL